MGAIESFATLPLQQVVPGYVYGQFADDPDIQAFFAGLNTAAQGYLDWFLSTPLGVYTSPYINGPLLDWIGQGVYNIPRPVLSTQTSSTTAGYNTSPYNAVPYNSLAFSSSGAAAIASDDIYKRVMTWNLYRGDGQMFTMQWLKNRINRFLNGDNGADYPVLNSPPSITVSGNTFSVQGNSSAIFAILAECFSNGEIAFPFQYSVIFTGYFVNNGGVLQLSSASGYPVGPGGIADGSIWNNGGVVCVVPGVTPNPSTPPVIFGQISPSALLSLGGGNLPLTNPGFGSNQLWNNGGVVSIA